jgi:ABC-2 type transport system ATP-binding protein
MFADRILRRSQGFHRTSFFPRSADGTGRSQGRFWIKLRSVLLVAFVLFGLACGRGSEDGVVTASGTIEAREVNIAAKISGELRELAVDEGSRVERGDILAVIDHDLLDIQLRQAEAGVVLAEAQLALLRKGARSEDIQQTEELVKQAEAGLGVAEEDVRRIRELAAEGGATPKQLDDAEARYAVALSQASAAREALRKIRNIVRTEEIQAAEARLDQARAAADLLRQTIADCTIVSPVSGVVTHRVSEPGEIVVPAATILTVSALDRVFLRIFVSEKELGRIRLGETAEVRVDAFPDRPMPGTIVYISPEAEFTPKNVQTKEDRVKLVFGVKIEIENRDGVLKPGLPADAASGIQAVAEIVVRTEGLGKSFGSIEAVRALDLEIPGGEMFALVGPDGAGKTTIIRMLCGILKPDSGRASVLGYDLGQRAEDIKTRIGYLSQRFSLYGDLTVDENIEFFAEIHGVRDFSSRRRELLELMRLISFRKRLADRLSGGMRQKLALACTLIHAPRLLLLDEPTTGVDPVSRRDFWRILSDLLREGITIVMTTPYMDEAERCGRVALLSEGLVLAKGTPRELKDLVPGAVVEVVCEEVRAAALLLRGTPGFQEVQMFGDRLNVVVGDPGEGRARIRTILSAGGIPVLKERIVPPSLENVFISVVSAAQERAGSNSERGIRKD